MTITGIGPIFVPHMITYFVHNYGAVGCMLLFGAIATHTFPTALLLQPVKWHMKKDDSAREIKELSKDVKHNPSKNCEDTQKLCADVANVGQENSKELKSEYEKVDSIWDVFLSEEEHEYLEKKNGKPAVPLVRIDGEMQIRDSSLQRPQNSISKQTRHSGVLTRFTSIFDIFQKQNKIQRKFASEPIIYKIEINNEKDSKSSHRISVVIDYFGDNKLDEDDDKGEWNETSRLTDGTIYIQTTKIASGSTILPKENSEYCDTTTCCKQFTNKVVQFFDLKLLADPTYIVIMIGISTSIFSEMNFSMLMPFILGDMGLTSNETAFVMSIIAISDIITRFVCPFVGDYFKQTPRKMFINSLVILIFIRTGLIYSNSCVQIMLYGLGLGVSKGIRVVYTGLIIPGYVPLERLPCALGLQNVSNGIFVLGLGPLLGVIRDYSGSYTKVLIFLNTSVLFIIIMWGVENWWKTTRTKKPVPENDNDIPE